MLQVKLIIGSTREGRAADLVAPWLVRGLKSRDDFELEVLDLREPVVWCCDAGRGRRFRFSEIVWSRFGATMELGR